MTPNYIFATPYVISRSPNSISETSHAILGFSSAIHRDPNALSGILRLYLMHLDAYAIFRAPYALSKSINRTTKVLF